MNQNEILVRRRREDEVAFGPEDNLPFTFLNPTDNERVVASLPSHFGCFFPVSLGENGVVPDAPVEGGENVHDTYTEFLHEKKQLGNFFRPIMNAIGKWPFIESEFGNASACSRHKSV